MDVELARCAAIRAVREAVTATEAVRLAMDESDRRTKTDRSPVTVADFAAQAIITKLLHADFPDVSVVAEETAAELRDESSRHLRARIVDIVRRCPGLEALPEGEILELLDLGAASPPVLTLPADAPGEAPRPSRYFWCIDPVDGTKGFLRNEQYAVCVGLVEVAQDGWGTPVLGVLGCPQLPETLAAQGAGSTVAGSTVAGAPLGLLFHAAQGRGAFCEKLEPGAEPLHIGCGSSFLSRCVESVEPGHTDQTQNSAICAAVGIKEPPLRMDSQCKYAVVAKGEASLYMRLSSRSSKQNIWDHAAGACIVTEAGGCCTDSNGVALDFGAGRKLLRNASGLVTSISEPLHGSVIAAIAAIPGTEVTDLKLDSGLELTQVENEWDVQGAAALLCLCDMEFDFPTRGNWGDRVARAAAGIRSYLGPLAVAGRHVVFTHGPESDAQRERSAFWILRITAGLQAGAIVGTVAVHPGKGGDHQAGGPDDPSVAVLARFGLAPALRQRGLGQHMYDTVERFCLEDGDVRRIWLETSRRQMAARKLYERNGFVVEKEVDNEWEDSLMSKPLTATTTAGTL